MRRILVADDSPVIRMLIRATLEPLGYRILDAADGDAAWAFLQREQFDAAILDVTMPGRGGFELLRLIRAHATLGALPVILVSGYSGAQDVRDGLAAGADLYLTKPFQTAELCEVVRLVLNE